MASEERKAEILKGLHDGVVESEEEKVAELSQGALDEGVDAYEAIMAYLWMTGRITIQEAVESLTKTLHIDSKTNRKKEGEVAAQSFQYLLEQHLDSLP